MPTMTPPNAPRRTVRLALAAACLATAAGLAACASPGAGTAAPGVPDAEADRRFYEARCGVCHVPFAKSDFPAEHWPAIVDEMAPRSGLSRAQRERVLRYLTSR